MKFALITSVPYSFLIKCSPISLKRLPHGRNNVLNFAISRRYLNTSFKSQYAMEHAVSLGISRAQVYTRVRANRKKVRDRVPQFSIPTGCARLPRKMIQAAGKNAEAERKFDSNVETDGIVTWQSGTQWNPRFSIFG